MHYPLQYTISRWSIFLLRRGAKVISDRGKFSVITNAAGAGNSEVLILLLSLMPMKWNSALVAVL